MLRLPHENPLPKGCSLAFGISQASKNQRHVALIYRSSSDAVMMLHHGWHRLTYHHPWDGQYFTINFSHLDIELQETFADWAVEVAGKIGNNPIPYGVFYNLKENFKSGGEYIDRDDGSGHTCATFLLDLFASNSLPLLDLSSWPVSRAGDFSWTRGMLQKLRKYLPRSYFVSQFRHRHKLRRFRPEEVASTAHTFKGLPLHFSVVEPAGLAIIDEIKSNLKMSNS